MVKRAGPLRLAFLDVLAAADGGQRGAALVTDARTVPVELRVTDPLAPTPIQRTLYGASFEEHAVLDLVALPLLRALREEISLVLVRAPRLLRIQERVPVPVLWVGRQEHLQPIGDAEEPGFLLASRDDRFPAVVALGFRGRHDETRSACELLQRVLQRNDLLEPFERLQQALTQFDPQQVAARGR
jgi:hypothetical protein